MLSCALRSLLSDASHQLFRSLATFTGKRRSVTAAVLASFGSKMQSRSRPSEAMYQSMLLPLVLLLLASRSCHMSTLSYGCPARALIKPCSCHDITRGLEIVCEGVHLQVLREVFENVAQTGQTLVYLKMKNNHMQTFPSLLLSKIDVRHLMAHKCHIVNVDSSAFSGMENKIESIDFSENKLTQIPSEALKGLSVLVSLNLNYNQIESIHENAFQGLDSLLRLSLFGNKIARIHPGAFVGIALNLTRINLGGNQLSTVPTEAVSVLSDVQRIQLHENQIRSFRPNDFFGLQSSQKLDMLNFAHNSLSRLEENVFLDLKILNSLDFESNQISWIDANAFNGLQETLQWLKLGENQLGEIPSEALRNLSQLRELDLRGNQISHIGRSSFLRYGRNVKFLYLQQNRIENIEIGAFDSLHSLEWLNLHTNRLTHISETLFAGLMNNMNILDMHDNPLRCTCELRWYQKWCADNEKKQMAHVHICKEIKCQLLPANHNDSIRLVSLQDLNQHLKCNALCAATNQLVFFSLTITALLIAIY